MQTQYHTRVGDLPALVAFQYFLVVCVAKERKQRAVDAQCRFNYIGYIFFVSFRIEIGHILTGMFLMLV